MKRRFVMNQRTSDRWNVFYHLYIKGKRRSLKFCTENFLYVLGIIDKDDVDEMNSMELSAKLPKAFTATLKKVTQKEAKKYAFYIENHWDIMDIMEVHPVWGEQEFTCFYAPTKSLIRKLWKIPSKVKQTEYYVFQVEYE